MLLLLDTQLLLWAAYEPVRLSAEAVRRIDDGANDLPLHHHDPFDRLLVAQARTLLTVDAKVVAYGEPVVDVGRVAGA